MRGDDREQLFAGIYASFRLQSDPRTAATELTDAIEHYIDHRLGGLGEQVVAAPAPSRMRLEALLQRGGKQIERQAFEIAVGETNQLRLGAWPDEYDDGDHSRTMLRIILESTMLADGSIVHALQSWECKENYDRRLALKESASEWTFTASRKDGREKWSVSQVFVLTIRSVGPVA